MFLKNWLGIKLPDDEMRQIPYPKLEVGWHISLKCMQATSIAGYFGSRLYLGFNTVIRKKSSFKNLTPQQFTEYSCRISRNFMLAGLIISIPMMLGHGYQNKVDDDGYYDRAYRIRYNESQLNVDRGSLLMATVYGAIFSYTSRSFLLGFPKGLCWGTILAATYNNFQRAQRAKERIASADSD